MSVEKTFENMEHCLCMQCPSYSMHCKLKNIPKNYIKLKTDMEYGAHFEKMFCAYERSDCIYQRHGCLCSVCEVARKYNLRKQNYCLQTGGM